MAVILNIETSTEVCSVNISRNGELLFEKESFEGLNHSQMLTVFIEELFREHGLSFKNLNAIAVSKGPGSYTGLRIGVSVAKGLCYALNVPLLAVGTIDSMGKFAAANCNNYISDCNNHMLFCPMIDARRMEVYTALYTAEGEQVEPVSAKVIDETSFSSFLENNRILFFGNGAKKCMDVLRHPNALFIGPSEASARFMIRYAEEKYNNKDWEDVAYFEPFYLKDFVATRPGKNKSK